MEHTFIVNPTDLSRYADNRESQQVIPELIYHLVRQSVPDARVCRIPYGDAVNQSGLDGLVECDVGFPPFVPQGISHWEIGTGADPQTKATQDFRKRTDNLDDSERAELSFVFVTPRKWQEPKQRAWIKQRENEGWKQIQIIDDVKLVDWLREFPALGRWMGKKLGITKNLGGMITPAEHWSLISQSDQGEPALPPELFTLARSAARNALEAVFNSDAKRLLLFSESEHDVDDFVSAYLATLEENTAQMFANRCLFISDEDAWRSICELRQFHVLVAHPRLGLDTGQQGQLQTIAMRKGHGVIIPLCGAWSDANPEILKLRSPSASQIETVLREANFSSIRARELGKIGEGRISALRRHFHGLSQLPPYATWETARQLAQAGLIGRWDAKNPADLSAISELLGKDYREWIETLRIDVLRSDAPLLQTDEKWRFVARGEAWNALGPFITDQDLDRFETIAIAILEERNPELDLPKEERYAAAIYGKEFKHSLLIRYGLIETLALLGSRSSALSSCSHGKAETTVLIVVRKLLEQANWERWASLNSHLRLLAEAAPNEFLDAVESALVELSTTPFHAVFAQEGDGGVGGCNYITGLLWALESLAWHPDHLSRVAVILANLAAIDPGGKRLNRPANSLADIFLPWHVQTTAPFEKRKNVLKAILREQPEVGWALLLALLPHSHGATTGCHHPIWREFIPRDWQNGVTQKEYWEQISTFTELTVELAKQNVEKLIELINRLPDLPLTAHKSILEHLSSENIVNLTESERLPIWEALTTLVRLHRKFYDAKWALPEEAIAMIEETANFMSPSASELKYHYLFSENDSELFFEKGNYKEQGKYLDQARQAAVAEILGDNNLDAVLKFSAKVTKPIRVGEALGVIASTALEGRILPSFLDSKDEVIVAVVSEFIWSRFWQLKFDWIDSVLKKDWTSEHKAKFLTFLPFNEETWQRVNMHLGNTYEVLYWKNARVNPYGADRDLTVAIQKLLKYGRSGAAVTCAAHTINAKERFNESLATQALLAVLESESGLNEFNHHDTVKLITHLQNCASVDQKALFTIEWNFLPWLDKFSSGSPLTLEKQLATEPTFFAEVIRIVYRSKHDKESDEEILDEQKQRIAQNAYKLLREWRRIPGKQDNGSFDINSFNQWLNEARRITEESGHKEVAQFKIGEVLTHALPDPNGLWIHEAVAAILNARDTSEMRSGFRTELYNQRGVHGFTHGREERELANKNREKAEALDSKGYTRFAATMREFAAQYDREAEREENREPFED